MKFSNLQCLEAMSLIPAEGTPLSRWIDQLRQRGYTTRSATQLLEQLKAAPICRVVQDSNNRLSALCSFNVDPSDNRSVDAAELQWL